MVDFHSNLLAYQRVRDSFGEDLIRYTNIDVEWCGGLPWFPKENDLHMVRFPVFNSLMMCDVLWLPSGYLT